MNLHRSHFASIGLLLLLAHSAYASPTTLEIGFSATFGSAQGRPVDGSVTLTLDPDGPAVVNQLVDSVTLTIVGHTYSASEVGFNYDPASEFLQIGGLSKGVASFGPINNGFTGTDDFRLETNRVTGICISFWYNSANDRHNLYNHRTCSVTLVDDTDGDGVPDSDDICEGGDDNVDSDGDLVPDFCDPCPLDAANDADGDGFCADADVCPGGDDNVNNDNDSLPDFCDVCPFDPENDADADGVCGDIDNCPEIDNSTQTDTDQDGAGDACDIDDDGDGVDDGDDNCPLTANENQADTDGDLAGDACDADDDNDGVDDANDSCPTSPLGDAVNTTGCAVVDLCPCDNQWKNHGAYVRCVAHAARDFVAEGVITQAEKNAIVSAAGASSCGHKNK